MIGLSQILVPSHSSLWVKTLIYIIKSDIWLNEANFIFMHRTSYLILFVFAHITQGSVNCICIHNSWFILWFYDLPAYINNLLKNIIRSLVSIYPNDTTAYGYTLKNLDDKSMTADLWSDLALTAQWWEKLAFNASKTKSLTFYQDDFEFSPVPINGCTLTEAPCLVFLLGLK